MNSLLSAFLTIVLALVVVGRETTMAFSVAPAIMRSSPRLVAVDRLSMSTTEDASTESDTVLTTPSGLNKRDRYIATNRFAVRKDQQAKFEKRWATRKSRLATLDGFKYFHLMRRVSLNKEDGSTVYDGGYQDGADENAAQENYVSFTVWNKKSDFSTWRKGDAFKEAHGGTSIGAFLTTMVSSAMVLRGAPRPAFYDSLFMESSKPASVPETVDGWRNVQADGVNTLPAECFVALEKYFVSRDEAASFEKQWQQVNSSPLTNVNGFVLSSLMRRDGQAKGHGIKELTSDEPTYVACKIFQDRNSYEQWAESQPVEKGFDSTLWNNREPEKVFYEGALVISSADGA